jgi:hypothetical protein
VSFQSISGSEGWGEQGAALYDHDFSINSIVIYIFEQIYVRIPLNCRCVRFRGGEKEACTMLSSSRRSFRRFQASDKKNSWGCWREKESLGEALTSPTARNHLQLHLHHVPESSLLAHSGRDNKTLRDCVAAGDFSAMQKLINHTSSSSSCSPRFDSHFPQPEGNIKQKIHLMSWLIYLKPSLILSQIIIIPICHKNFQIALSSHPVGAIHGRLGACQCDGIFRLQLLHVSMALEWLEFVTVWS